MITEDKRFIDIQGILAMSDVHPEDCIKINDLIIELSKENKKQKEVIDKATEYIESKEYQYGDEEQDNYDYDIGFDEVNELLDILESKESKYE